MAEHRRVLTTSTCGLTSPPPVIATFDTYADAEARRFLSESAVRW